MPISQSCDSNLAAHQRQFLSVLCGDVLSHGGTPSYHPFIDGLSILNQPAIGGPQFMETPIYEAHLSFRALVNLSFRLLAFLLLCA